MKRIAMTAVAMICGFITGYCGTMVYKDLNQASNQATPARCESIPQHALKSVVRIRVHKTVMTFLGPMDGDATGSGVVIGSRSILTARHVVDGSADCMVDIFSMDGGYRTIKGVVHAVSARDDLALIRVDDILKTQAVVGLKAMSTLAPGDPVVAIGCAMGHTPYTCTTGYFASRGTEFEEEPAWGQMSTIIYFGNSGGAVFDPNTWSLIGIAVASDGPTTNYFVNAYSIAAFLKESE